MVKILSRSGASLADIYDVRGSIAGIDQLETRELPIVHEMGATVFSERYQQTIRRLATAAIGQNTTWDLELADLPAGITRILGLGVFQNGAAGVVLHAQVSVRDDAQSREIPIWVWDDGIDAEPRVRIQDAGAAVATQFYLRAPMVEGLPSMLTSTGQTQQTPNIFFRGLTSGFGAGTIICTMVLLIGHTAQPNNVPSSIGLPVPSW